MEFSIERKRLQDALQKVMRAVALKNTVEVLSGVLLEVNDDKRMLVLTATDLTLTMQVKLKNVSVTMPGNTVVHAKILVEMLGSMSGETAVIKQRDGCITVQCGNSIYRGHVMNAEQFPKVSIVYPDNTICVTGISLLSKKATMLASERNDNPVFQGVQMRFSPSVTTATSSDGVRFVKSKSEGISDGSLDMFIPERALKILHGSVRAGDDLYIGKVNNTATFMTSEFVFTTQLNDTNLERVEAMMEKITAVNSVTVHAKTFSQAVDCCISLVNGYDSCVNLTLTGNSIILSVDNENGCSQIEVDAEKVTDMQGKVYHYKPNFIFEALRSCSGMVTVDFDQRGIMKIHSDTTDYVITPRIAARVKVAEVSDNDKEATVKKRKTTKAKKGKAAKTAA